MIRTMKKPIPTADRPDLNAVADFLEQLHAELTGGTWSRVTVEDRAWAAHRHAQTLRRIACSNRAGHAILRHDGTCAGCGTAPADDEVRS